jgi:hypothetical protein
MQRDKLKRDALTIWARGLTFVDLQRFQRNVYSQRYGEFYKSTSKELHVISVRCRHPSYFLICVICRENFFRVKNIRMYECMYCYSLESLQAEFGLVVGSIVLLIRMLEYT